LLTGKYSGMDDPALDEKGRFSSEYAGTKENPNPSYRGRYFKPAVFDAIGTHIDILMAFLACCQPGSDTQRGDWLQ
jgi:hypothetical protein